MSIRPFPILADAPDTLKLRDEAKRRDVWFRLAGFFGALACALSFIAFDYASPLIPIALILVMLLPVLTWNIPRLMYLFLLPAVCLIELGDSGNPDEIFGKIPLFWNINTAIQIYTRADFKALPISLLELLFLLAASLSFVKAVFHKSVGFQVGTLLKPILIYEFFVLISWVNGIMTGGDFKISLQETRAQFYFLFSYLIAAHQVRTREQINKSLWVFAFCVAIKGATYVFRYFVTLRGLQIPDQGVGSHEEAFFFGAYTVLLIVLPLCGVEKKLQKAMWLMLPLVIVGNMVTNRRAGTAGLTVALIMLFPAAWLCFPQRRKVIVTTALTFMIAFSIYYPIFRNKTGMFSLPARAFKTQFEPDTNNERDRSSNDYREAENACLMATIKQSTTTTLFGFGYGKRMLHVAQIADITKLYEWWDILPHNQILWIWMRTGLCGFLAFWMMIGSIHFEIGKVLRRPKSDAHDKAIAMFVLIILANLIMFGMLDLQLSNYRDMILSGLFVGILGGYLARKREGDEEAL
jgi:hypothetical protein